MLLQKNPKDASAIIIFYKNKVLMALRSKKKNIFYPNHFGLFGGAIEKNETFHDAAKRELFEETNIDTPKKNIRYLVDINFSFPKTGIIKRKIFTYKINNLIEFKNKFSLGEGQKSLFFTYKQIKKQANVVPYDRLALDLFFSRNKKFVV